MKQLQNFLWVLVAGVILVPFPLNAQPSENPTVEINDQKFGSQAPLSEEQIRQACVARRYDLLPIPFSDVSPTDWAFEAVMNLYYCIGLSPQFNSHSSPDQS